MAYGVQLFNSSGTLIYDSTTALGGVAADYQQFSAGNGSATLSYPQWAGYSAFLLDGYGNGYGSYASLSTSAGYPVVTITAGCPSAFAFVLVIY